MPIIISDEILEILIPWLKSHEDDIALEINDFGMLQPVFKELFMDDAKTCKFLRDANGNTHMITEGEL